MDAAKQLFNRIVNGGVGEIYRMIDEKEEENLFLDYKLAKNSPMKKEERTSLAKIVSAFANADGGVAIWGVNCESRGEEPDVPTNPEPIQKLKRFHTDLQSYTAQVVNPAVTGVQHEIIQLPHGNDEGLAVTYIPRSEEGPHMAIANNDQYCFFYRSCGSSRRMEHYMVADRFGRRPQPRLELDTQWNRTTRGVLIDIKMRNIGLGIALYPGLLLAQNNYFKIDTHLTAVNGLSLRLIQDSGPGRRFFVGGINDVIYPGTALYVTSMVFPINSDDESYLDIDAPYELYCQGFSYKGNLRISGDEIIRRRDAIFR
ncbi:MAG: AlbA family DNA-binding domain-containing protein [Armatimonadota bacterium]